MQGLLSARVGIHYRVLFRPEHEEGRLVVAAFTHRQGLATALKRLGK